jgi:hypothetical protein
LITVWSVLVLAALAATVVGLTLLTRAIAPVDTSSPRAAVQGYYAAVQAQDYTRAWQYTAASTKDQSQQSSFAGNLRADDAQYGRVLSVAIAAISPDSSGHATVRVTVSRSNAPAAPLSESVVLTQYGGSWLIDSVTSG